VIVADISQRRAEAVAGEINGAARRKKAIAVRGDVAKKSEVEAMVAEARKKFGPITVLVNNAGIAQIKDFLDISPEEWQRMLDVHMKGTFLCTQAVIPDMITANWGRIRTRTTQRRRRPSSVSPVLSRWNMPGQGLR
jgi:NAD(P)-dependent dehydrogenase (short-subunit alcohol dehydrogenase family)